MLKNLIMTLGEENNKILDVARALSTPQRLEILELLNSSSMSIKEIATFLNYPLSSTLLNVNVLAECGLIDIKVAYTDTGKAKICSRNCDNVAIHIFHDHSFIDNKYVVTVPIGNYTGYDVPSDIDCGMATKESMIGTGNDTDVFFNEERHKAALIWLTEGFLEYKLSNKSIPRRLNRVSISFEVCSEAPFYRNDWKSDITMFINDQEIGTWTSLGDYGGRRGFNNPKWWPDALTQFGVLTTWDITLDGTYVNNVKISDMSLEDIDIKELPYLKLKIGVKSDAKYVGGMSLFGRGFGDYNQDIIVSYHW